MSYVDDALDSYDVFELIAKEGFKPTIEDVLAVVDDDRLDHDLLIVRLADLTTELETAETQLIELVPVEQHHLEFDEFRRQHGLEVNHRSAWEWTYASICEEQREEWQKSQYRRQDYTPLIPGYLGIASPTLGVETAISSQFDRDRLKRLQAAVDQADTEYRTLRQEHRLATETYEATRQPEGFNLALQVLTFLAIAGMAIPVILMSLGPTSLPLWGRIAVTASFFVGVALLLRFLFVYASFLKLDGRPDLPVNAFGLIWGRRRTQESTANTGH